MLTLHFARHGQTDHSRENRFCGTTDAPLNEVGMKMAEALATRYRPGELTAIYASPLLRTRQTAEAVARRTGLGVTVLDGLREIAYGDWEGQPEKEVEK